jgi:hypothetical protein
MLLVSLAETLDNPKLMIDTASEKLLRAGISRGFPGGIV